MLKRDPRLERVFEELARTMFARTKLCIDCLENIAEPSSKLCPGCQAYREHQQ